MLHRIETLGSGLVEPTKTCDRCAETKPETSFHSTGPGRARERICGACRAQIRRIKGREKRDKTPKDRRARLLRQKYKITVRQYEVLLDAQGGRCAICQTEPPAGKPLVIDHCHGTGCVRALLCNLCNLMIGVYELNHQVAAEYLATYANGNPLLKQ